MIQNKLNINRTKQTNIISEKSWDYFQSMSWDSIMWNMLDTRLCDRIFRLNGPMISPNCLFCHYVAFWISFFFLFQDMITYVYFSNGFFCLIHAISCDHITCFFGDQHVYQLEWLITLSNLYLDFYQLLNSLIDLFFAAFYFWDCMLIYLNCFKCRNICVIFEAKKEKEIIQVA